MRRSPEAIITAHAMDPSRRELFVEGSRDRVFLRWLLAAENYPTSILEIALVDLPADIRGGERGRLIHFARQIGDREIHVRMFADADFDRLLSRDVPSRVWLTDHRDMEGYLLREECIDKVLRLGVATERISAHELLRAVQVHGRRLGLVRVLSEVDGLSLPFQATKLRRYLTLEDGRLDLDFDGYFRALLQNAGISLAKMLELQTRLCEVGAFFSGTPDSELVHGKDAICIVESALAKVGVVPGEGARLIWTSFETRFVENGTALDEVLGYIRGLLRARTTVGSGQPAVAADV